jgi:hypothetical protein
VSFLVANLWPEAVGRKNEVFFVLLERYPERTRLHCYHADPSAVRLFVVPWHAEALGIVNALVQSGMYSQVEWTEALSVLAALEHLVGEKSPETGGSLADSVEAWQRRYSRGI